MKELADARTAWHRGLWQPGTLVLLDEVAEAVQATWNGSIASDEAMKDVITVAESQLRRDPGVGDSSVRDKLGELLAALKPAGSTRSKPTVEAQGTLAQTIAFTDRCRTGYILRWKEHVDTEGISPVDVELSARLLVAHFFDEGFHRNHVHGWLTSELHDTRKELSTVLSRGREMLLQPTRRFDFCVGVVRAPQEVKESFGDRWLDSETYLELFKSANNANGRATPRAGAGAVEWSVEARDPHAALYELLEWQQKLLDRVQLGYGTGGKVEFATEVIDKTANRLRTPLEDRRAIRVAAIQRGRLFVGGGAASQQLDGAIGLLSSQSGETRGASIASVWAAAEGLLGRPGGKGVQVADRLADIVACSFPRAELGDLARRWSEEGVGDLAEKMKDQPSADQAHLMAEQLMRAGDPGFRHSNDQAAVARYLQLASDPAAVLGRVRNYYSSAFRRLYYQRNFVMHAAKFDSVTLGVSARTAPYLVAAALDRIVNAQQGNTPISPLSLAARAENELAMLGKSGARPIYALLD
ncbi:MAG: Integrase, catalytic region [Microbacterium sp.]|nr:Integrase, catalytic region [Microbacterium sp.]